MSEEGDVFKTRYSAYRVDSWFGRSANDNHQQPSAGDINGLVQYFHNKSKSAGWWEEGGRDLTGDKYVHATKLMLVVTELAEAMEGLRKGLMDDKLPHRKMAEVELADALIRICDLAGVLGYDLGGAVVEKDAFNTVRPDHQPGNRMLAGGKAY
jgi:NTP pyrophosphatase (non-canonical NTP hydrolase)